MHFECGLSKSFAFADPRLAIFSILEQLQRVGPVYQMVVFQGHNVPQLSSSTPELTERQRKLLVRATYIYYIKIEIGCFYRGTDGLAKSAVSTEMASTRSRRRHRGKRPQPESFAG
jgi:hypothetical protein